MDLGQGVTSKEYYPLYHLQKSTLRSYAEYFCLRNMLDQRSKSIDGSEENDYLQCSMKWARYGGLIAPDETTFNYLKEKDMLQKGGDWIRQSAIGKL